jgi:hypothetical protein
MYCADCRELKTGDAASVKGLSSYKGVKFIIHGLGGHYEEDIYTALSDGPRNMYLFNCDPWQMN